MCVVELATAGLLFWQMMAKLAQSAMSAIRKAG